MATLGTFASGQILTAAELNAIGTFTNYTPTLTGITVGNGTTVARYVEINQIVFWSVVFTFGSTSSVTAAVFVSLPSTAGNLYEAANSANCQFEDVSASIINGGFVQRDSGTRVGLRVANAAGTYSVGTALSSTVPFSWANGDIIAASGFYRKA